jgi:purine-nucleoside phosphorylase
MAVEMEAAALYAFAQGEADGSYDALQLIAIAADRLRSRLLP